MRRTVGLRARQLPALARRAITHPHWFVETVRLARYRREQLQAPPQFGVDSPHRADAADAVAAVTGVARREAERALADVWRPEAAVRHPIAARDLLLDVVGALVRLLRPAVVAEAGVAEGFTTAVALHYLDELETGRLYSVDLPVLESRADEFVGRVVPAELRGRWTLELGPSRLVLPNLLERVSPLDLFIHDADHTYPGQMADYRIVWPHLRPGGVLLSDDLANAAFVDFAAEFGVRPYLIGPSADIGLLRKPVADA